MKDPDNQHDVKVGVVLLNWNGGEFTIPCIESLLAGTMTPWRILVWDNASDDGSPDRIAERFPEVKVICSASNEGFARGNNLGAVELLREGADYIWVLNNDTIVDSCCLEKLLGSMERRPEAAAAIGKILYAEPSDLIWYAGAVCRPWSLEMCHRGASENDRGQYDQEGPVPFISGCCMLIRREALQACGLFDERYFIYYEDSDWSLRIRQNRWMLWYEPGAILWHRVSASMKKNTLGRAGGSVSAKQHYYSTRNRLFTIRRHANRPWQFVSAVTCLLFDRVLISAGLLVFQKWEKVRALWRGVADGWRTPVEGVCCELGVQSETSTGNRCGRVPGIPCGR